MILIFWEISEKPEVKKKIAKQLGELEKHINESNQKVVKVIFNSAKNIRKLNKTYRQIDKVTDVLSFTEDLGEIYINYDWIKSGERTTEELFIHGYLHLLGYDHESDNGEMEQLEKLILRKG
jgi:probable rRNA maturation factor